MSTIRDDAPSSLQHHLYALRRRAWVVVLCGVVTSLVALALSLSQPTRYEASAEILLNRQYLAAALTGTQDSTAGQQPERITQTQADLARVPELASRVLRAVGLEDRGAAWFLAASYVTTKSNSDLIDFHVRDAVPATAERLATEYARQFTAYRRELDTAPIVRARASVEAQISDLEQRGDTRTALYASLVDKDQQLRTLEALLTSPATLVRPALGAGKVQPTPVRNAVLGVLLGVAIGLGLAFLWEALDTRLRTTDVVVNRLGVPLLARLPAPPRHLAEKNRLVMLDEPGEPEAEPFRVLRTNLEFANLERGARTIMVTSALPSEGKSTTAANLALALARAGRHVVLVDLDLRRPIVATTFGLEGRPGITHVALGQAQLPDALYRVPLMPFGRSPLAVPSRNGRVPETLYVLPAGLVPPQPGEFVASRAVAGILADLAADAHFVIVDAPPLLGVGDALTLSARVDALLVVAHLGLARRQTVDELKRVLGSSPAVVLGLVATNASNGDGYYGSSYYHLEGEERGLVPPDALRGYEAAR